ncbi:MAG: lytic transglycosylase domain-containing protein, partial [Xanthomonadales bacterium]|nr:lytic transglycosylase domain-containing protein [Xanthomonadales bacterium]
FATLPLAASAQVKLLVGDDGVPFIYNETPLQHGRRIALHLVPVPNAEHAAMIRRHADRERLSPRLVQALVQVESGYNPRAVSSKGAQGLMQLMPETSRELAVDDPFDPDQNLRGGTRYLRSMLDRFGDLQMALAAYNAGPTAVSRFGGIPPYAETQGYVRRILGLFHGDPDVEVPVVGSAPSQPGPKIYVVSD